MPNAKRTQLTQNGRDTRPATCVCQRYYPLIYHVMRFCTAAVLALYLPPPGFIPVPLHSADTLPYPTTCADWFSMVSLTYY